LPRRGPQPGAKPRRRQLLGIEGDVFRQEFGRAVVVRHREDKEFVRGDHDRTGDCLRIRVEFGEQHAPGAGAAQRIGEGRRDRLHEMVGHRVADPADDFGLIEPIVLRGVGLGGLEPRQKLIGVARIVAIHLAQNPGDGAGG